MTFINRFKRSCGNFGKEKKTIVVNDTRLVCQEKNLKIDNNNF